MSRKKLAEMKLPGAAQIESSEATSASVHRHLHQVAQSEDCSDGSGSCDGILGFSVAFDLGRIGSLLQLADVELGSSFNGDANLEVDTSLQNIITVTRPQGQGVLVGGGQSERISFAIPKTTPGTEVDVLAALQDAVLLTWDARFHATTAASEPLYNPSIMLDPYWGARFGAGSEGGGVVEPRALPPACFDASLQCKHWGSNRGSTEFVVDVKSKLEDKACQEVMGSYQERQYVRLLLTGTSGNSLALTRSYTPKVGAYPEPQYLRLLLAGSTGNSLALTRSYTPWMVGELALVSNAYPPVAVGDVTDRAALTWTVVPKASYGFQYTFNMPGSVESLLEVCVQSQSPDQPPGSCTLQLIDTNGTLWETYLTDTPYPFIESQSQPPAGGSPDVPPDQGPQPDSSLEGSESLSPPPPGEQSPDDGDGIRPAMLAVIIIVSILGSFIVVSLAWMGFIWGRTKLKDKQAAEAPTDVEGGRDGQSYGGSYGPSGASSGASERLSDQTMTWNPMFTHEHRGGHSEAGRGGSVEPAGTAPDGSAEPSGAVLDDFGWDEASLEEKKSGPDEISSALSTVTRESIRMYEAASDRSASPSLAEGNEIMVAGEKSGRSDPDLG
eukprot:gene18446-24925_t